MAMLTYSDFPTWPSDARPPQLSQAFLYSSCSIYAHIMRKCTNKISSAAVSDFRREKKVLFILLFVWATRRAAESSTGSQEEGPARIPQPESDRCVCASWLVWLTALEAVRVCRGGNGKYVSV